MYKVYELIGCTNYWKIYKLQYVYTAYFLCVCLLAHSHLAVCVLDKFGKKDEI